MIIIRCRHLCFVLALSAFVAYSSASNTVAPYCEMWERIQTPTTDDLWGVTKTDFGYVAVGTKGTILTSPEGKVWTSRSSGTNEWLLGAAFGNGSVVVTGDHGTILRSVDGGVTWNPQNSGTSERLNGICFYRYNFLAVGEKGTTCISSDTTWTTSNSGSEGWLRGITPDSTLGGFIFAGASGRIFSIDPFGHYLAAINTAGPDLEAVLGIWTKVFCVGDRGIWLYGASFRQVLEHPSHFRGISSPSFYTPNEYIDSAHLNISAFGTGGALALSPRVGIDRWFSVQLPGADNLNAASRDVACGQCGIVWLQIDPSVGASVLNITQDSTVPEHLYEGGSLIFGPSIANLSGMTFQWYKNGLILDGETRPTISLDSLSGADVATYTCAISKTNCLFLWHLHLPPVLPSPPSVLAIEPQGLIHGSYSAFFPESNELAGPDGSLKLTLQGDTLFINRLGADGNIDSQFPTASVFIGSAPYGDNGTPADFSATTGADGKIWIAVRQWSNFNQSANTVIFRLLPSLQKDDSFTRIVLGKNASVYFRPPFIYAFDRQSGTVLGHPGVKYLYDAFHRYFADGTLDPSYHPDISGSRIISQAIHQDGSVILLRAYTYELGLPQETYITDQVPVFWPQLNTAYRGALPSPDSILVYRMQRLAPDGSLDPDFRADLDIAGTVNSMRYIPDGSILMEGALVAINGVQCVSSADLTKITSHQMISTVRIVPDRRSSATHLAGISSRAVTGPDSETLITGFLITGNAGRTMVLSGIGPGLASHGVSSPLASPVLTLFNGLTALLSNDNWETLPAKSLMHQIRSRTGAYPLLSGVKDACSIAGIGSGPYSVLITSKTAQNGVALAEVYDASDAPRYYADGRVSGFSTRGKTGAGEDVMIAGFVIQGSNSKRVLICGSGPALSALGVQGAIPTVKLSLYQRDRLLTVAHPGIQKQLMPVIDYVLGKDHLSSDSNDTAMCVTLLPGAYSVVMSGETDADTGVGLIEVFEAP